MGCGLWLSATVARELVQAPERLARLLDSQGLVLFTLNGFPFGDFHEKRVKENVYSPAWDDPARLAYTLDLARVLAYCLPHDEAEGTISTVPFGFAPLWNTRRHTRALAQVCTAARELAALERQTGRRIRLCLEPEPCCLLETTEQAIALFTEELPSAAADSGVEADVLRRHLGLCLDICHQAVMFEEPAESLCRLYSAGVPIGKIQVSSALEVPDPSSADTTRILAELAEPRYLHQVRALDEAGRILGAVDLEQASEISTLPRRRPWRIHFHVPIQDTMLYSGALATTRTAISSLLDGLARYPRAARPHLEVETYTWWVLPPHRRPATAAELEEGIAAELGWLESQLAARGLLEDPLSADFQSAVQP
jgi:sugar phosphate isomerase/epimerase